MTSQFSRFDFQALMSSLPDPKQLPCGITPSNMSFVGAAVALERYYGCITAAIICSCWEQPSSPNSQGFWFRFVNLWDSAAVHPWPPACEREPAFGCCIWVWWGVCESVVLGDAVCGVCTVESVLTCVRLPACAWRCTCVSLTYGGCSAAWSQIGTDWPCSSWTRSSEAGPSQSNCKRTENVCETQKSYTSTLRA